MLNESLSQADVDVHRLGAQLDAMAPEQRLQQVRSLGKRAQARLFEAAADASPLSVADLVADAPAMQQVAHEGRNTLPAFRYFAKVFCRPEDNPAQLWGYNRTSGTVSTWVGPGYYVAYDDGDEVLIDYRQLPTGKLEGWPRILPNDARLSRFVYHNMVDVLRRVSAHVSIGRAVRDDKPMDSWFVLCRQQPMPS